MNKHDFLLQTGQAGLAVCAMGAAVLAGLSPLTPLVAGGALYVATRYSRGRAARDAQIITECSKENLKLEAGDPVYDRVAAMATRMGVAAPHVFLAPPRLGKVNVAAISSLSKYADKRGVLLIPSSLYDETVPGRQPVFTPDEQDAVIAHELAHIRHNDSLRITGHNMAKSVTMISYIFAGIGMFLGAVPMGAFLGCAALYSGATWLQQFCSRQVEYRTDSTAIAFTKNPAALASALEKIQDISKHLGRFLDNAADITDIQSPHASGVSFKPKAAFVQTDSPWMKPLVALAQSFSTHPGRNARYKNICETAVELGLPPLPARCPPVDIKSLLRETDDGIVLPPFALPQTIRRNEAHGIVTVITVVNDFNRAANPGRGQVPRAPFPSPTPRKNDRQPTPWD